MRVAGRCIAGAVAYEGSQWLLFDWICSFLLFLHADVSVVHVWSYYVAVILMKAGFFAAWNQVNGCLGTLPVKLIVFRCGLKLNFDFVDNPLTSICLDYWELACFRRSIGDLGLNLIASVLPWILCVGIILVLLSTDLQLLLNDIFKVSTLQPLLSLVILHVELFGGRAWQLVHDLAVSYLPRSRDRLPYFLADLNLFRVDLPRFKSIVHSYLRWLPVSLSIVNDVFHWPDVRHLVPIVCHFTLSTVIILTHQLNIRQALAKLLGIVRQPFRLRYDSFKRPSVRLLSRWVLLKLLSLIFFAFLHVVRFWQSAWQMGKVVRHPYCL